MARTKILPRYLLLLLFPIIAAVLGGLLYSGSYMAYTNNKGITDISQAEINLALSFFIGILAIAYYCFSKNILLGLQIFIPLLYGLLMLLRFKTELSLVLLFLLNLACGFLLWLILRYTYLAKTLIRLRTLIFSFTSAFVFAIYLKLLMALIKQPNAENTFRDLFLNALVLFIFIGVGISLAILIITRKDIKDMAIAKKDNVEENDDF